MKELAPALISTAIIILGTISTFVATNLTKKSVITNGDEMGKKLDEINKKLVEISDFNLNVERRIINLEHRVNFLENQKGEKNHDNAT